MTNQEAAPGNAVSLPSSDDEVERVMAWAEELQAKVDAARNRRDVTRLQAIAFLLLTLLIWGGLDIGFGPAKFVESSSRFGLLMMGGAISAIIAILFFWMIWGTWFHRALERDQRALSATVHLLRQIERTRGEHYLKTGLARAQFRIRIARFDVGPVRSLDLKAMDALEDDSTSSKHRARQRRVSPPPAFQTGSAKS